MVPLSSHGIPSVPRYFGYCRLLRSFVYTTLTPYGAASQLFRLNLCNAFMQSTTPTVLLRPVWPLPLSLATTSGISFDFSSSPYLDVSVQAVPLIQLWIHCMIHRRYPMWIAPFGHLRINACLQLPAAFRSLPRPSSAPSAKAFTLSSL